MTIKVIKDCTLIEAMLEEFGESSRTKIKKMIKYGFVSKDGAALKHPEHKLKAGEKLEFKKYSGREAKAEKSPFRIVYEDQTVIAVMKPAGVITVGTTTEKTRSMFKMVQKYVEKKSKNAETAFVVHRLDREVAGILLFAKTARAKAFLIDNWKNTQKYYYALVEGVPEKDSGTIKSYLAEDKTDKFKRVKSIKNPPKNAELQMSITHYKVIERYDGCSLLQVDLETGTKNQIRAHLAEMGCPIIGDRRYGAEEEYIRQIRLLAFSLTFVHPETRKKVKLEVSLPKTFLTLNEENETYK